MRKFVPLFVWLFVLLSLGGVVAHYTGQDKQKPPQVVTQQQKSSHMITLLNEDGEEEGTCTATAVGPHALLSAEHCFLRGNKIAEVLRVDLSTRRYNIVAGAGDNRDHVLILVDGPAFTNLTSIVQAQAPPLGTKVYMYGNGGGEYPGRKLSGEVISCEDDNSDVDQYAGEVCFTTPVIGGDSGSAVYNEKGEIIALITYGYVDVDNKTHLSASFALDFKTDTLKLAATFSGDPKEIKENDGRDSSTSNDHSNGQPN